MEIDDDYILEHISPQLRRQHYNALIDSSKYMRMFDCRLAETFGMFEAVFISLLGVLCKRTSKGGKIINGKRWVFNTYEQWHENYFGWISPREISKAVLRLEKEGYVLSCQPDGFNKKKYYRPNDDKIIIAVMKNFPETYLDDNESDLFDDTQSGAMEHTQKGGFNNTRLGVFINSNNISNNDSEIKDDEEEERNENFNSSIQKQETAKVFKSYESEIGVLTSLIGNEIKAFLEQDNVSPDWIIAAIEEASRNNARSWSYVSAIIKRWQVDGFQSSNKPESKPKGKGKVQSARQNGATPDDCAEDDDWEGFDGDVPF